MPALSAGEAIGNAAVVGMTAEGFTYGTPPVVVPVVGRKGPALPEGEVPPQIVIVVGEEARSERISRRVRCETYRLAVVLVTGGGRKAADDPGVRDFRRRAQERIDDQERATFATLPPGVERQCVDTVGGRPPFDPALLHKDFNYSAVLFDVSVLVTRASG